MERGVLRRRALITLGAVVGSLAILFSVPTVLKITVQYEQARQFAAMQKQFPVTVNPQDRTITEDPHVNAYLGSSASPLQAAVGNVANVVGEIFTLIAITIANSPWYESLASADGRYVNVMPGMRKEQVASTFAKALGWTTKQQKEFLTPTPYSPLPLAEGSFAPGVYIVSKETTPLVAQALVNQRFSQTVLSHYSTTTAEIVPLADALSIASLIEREAGGADDMRYISGIIWNRLFINMNLQIDATLQYAKANTASAASWWPRVAPSDQYRRSAFNTYLHAGLPPTPIANPSVAAILAALNPKKTTCLFYFHDASGGFHCSDTYAEHVALLKKYYGKGK